jgi:Rrf2 family protein
MRISAKGRYALAAMIKIAERENTPGNTTVASISEELDISKIYLEKVFSQLKKAGIVTSVKGPKGGYQFSKTAAEITAWDILTSIESNIAEPSEDTVATSDPGMEMTLKHGVFEKLDEALETTLSEITVADLRDQALSQRTQQSFMMGI